MTDRYREECEAVLAGREGTALGLAVELQQARSGMAAKETECNVLKVSDCISALGLLGGAASKAIPIFFNTHAGFQALPDSQV